MSKTSVKRAIIVHPSDNLDTVPTACILIDFLLEESFEVDAFIFEGSDYPAPDFKGAIRFYSLGGHRATRSAGPHQSGDTSAPIRLARTLPAPIRISLRLIRRVGRSLLLVFKRFSVKITVARKHSSRPYSFVVGVEPEGLVIARSLTRGLSVPLVYLSLELLLSGELVSRKDRKLKNQELALSRRARLILIQDQPRAERLAQENSLSMDKFLLLPNGPMGPGRRGSSGYWHKRFNLPSNALIALHAGSLGLWTDLDAVAESTREWPKGWRLVIHTRHEGGADADADRLNSLQNDKVFTSFTPVSRHEFAELVDGADVGLAFYKRIEGSTYTQENLDLVGLSSGKAASYLRAGLPIVVNDGNSLSQFVSETGCGVVVSDATQIASALKEIERDYDRFSKRAISAFDDFLDVSRVLPQLRQRLQEIALT